MTHFDATCTYASGYLVIEPSVHPDLTLVHCALIDSAVCSVHFTSMLSNSLLNSYMDCLMHLFYVDILKQGFVTLRVEVPLFAPQDPSSASRFRFWW